MHGKSFNKVLYIKPSLITQETCLPEDSSANRRATEQRCFRQTFGLRPIRLY